MTDSHNERGVLSDDHPHVELYWSAVPIWCEGSEEELDWDTYGCGFSAGFERGIIMAMLHPEWAQGFYFKLRSYYLRTHTPEDLRDWDRCADETARPIRIAIVS